MIMRKFVVGFVVGLFLASAFPAYGAVSSLVGKKITKEVKVTMLGGELEKKAILIDGTTYVPLRVVTEKLGLQAAFVNGEVVIRNKSVEQQDIELNIGRKKKEIDDHRKKIVDLDEQIVFYEKSNC